MWEIAEWGLPQCSLWCTNGERKGQDKKRVHGNKKTVDMKEAREQERGTLTKDGKAWS